MSDYLYGYTSTNSYIRMTRNFFSFSAQQYVTCLQDFFAHNAKTPLCNDCTKVPVDIV